jgi:hypothetical protein
MRARRLSQALACGEGIAGGKAEGATRILTREECAAYQAQGKIVVETEAPPATKPIASEATI